MVNTVTGIPFPKERKTHSQYSVINFSPSIADVHVSLNHGLGSATLNDAPGETKKYAIENERIATYLQVGTNFAKVHK